MTPDAHPILGRVADGVYAACGFSGHGFMQSPAVASAVAEEILDGESAIDLGPYRLERFAGGAAVPRDARPLSFAAMCFDLDSLAADPGHRRRRGLARRPRARGGRRQPPRRLRRAPRRAGLDRDRDPPGRPRPLPLLRGARAPLRRARLHPRSRSTTSAARAGVAKRDDDFPYMEHVGADDPRGNPGRRRRGRRVSPRRGRRDTVFTVGFCFGGRNSWLSAAGGHGLAGAVGFYGMPGERNGQPGPTQRAAELAAPILALQAGDDANITAEDNAAFDAGADGRRGRARARHLRGRPAQLLRPQVRGVRRRLGGRLAARPRLHRAHLAAA